MYALFFALMYRFSYTVISQYVQHYYTTKTASEKLLHHKNYDIINYQSKKESLR